MTRYVALALAAFLIGALASSLWHFMERDFTTVRVIDQQDCADPEYYLEMASQTISVRGKQIDQTGTGMMAAKSEAYMYVPRIPFSTNDLRYRIRARYSDCAEALGGERAVTTGSILYETIQNGAIHHQVRSR